LTARYLSANSGGGERSLDYPGFLSTALDAGDWLNETSPTRAISKVIISTRVLFSFRFWQYGEWTDVVVDDYLPSRDGRLVYMRSQERGEFWSALLEKAYAKLHGSYRALRGGTTAEAMTDFSGGCTEVYDLKDAPGDVFDIMMKTHARNSMQACSVEADPYVFEAKTDSGLVRGHAYSLTKVVKAKVDTGRKQGLFPLVRIRNPWGNDTEWKGAWSDGSMEWKFIPEGEKSQLGLTFDEDGEFYMSQKDFLTQFDTLEICNLSPESMGEEAGEDCGQLQWNEQRFNGSWVAGVTAGGCRNFIDSFADNPQFKVTLTDSDDDDDALCTCVISLMQKGGRKRKAIRGGGGNLTIGKSPSLYLNNASTFLIQASPCTAWTIRRIRPSRWTNTSSSTTPRAPSPSPSSICDR